MTNFKTTFRSIIKSLYYTFSIFIAVVAIFRPEVLQILTIRIMGGIILTNILVEIALDLLIKEKKLSV